MARMPTASETAPSTVLETMGGADELKAGGRWPTPRGWHGGDSGDGGDSGEPLRRPQLTGARHAQTSEAPRGNRIRADGIVVNNTHLMGMRDFLEK